LKTSVCLDTVHSNLGRFCLDSVGQERYHSLAPMYYRGAQAAIVVYDITNQVSLNLSLCYLHYCQWVVVDGAANYLTGC